MNKNQKNDLKEVGERIRNARKAQGLTQETVAERSGITSQFMSRIETGHMGASADTYCRIASALELTADDLLYDNATNIRLQKAFSKEEILKDCTSYEKAIISEMMLALKDILKRNRRL